jgi:hypothetical protein
MMRLVGLLGVTFTLASCADTGPSGGTTLSTLVSPTRTVSAQISPQSLPLANAVTLGCPLAPTIRFDLIILPSQLAPVSVESVTVRLIDGTTLGGPMLTFPRADLNRLFGSTLVLARRVFTFSAQFGCAPRLPRSMVVDVVVADGNGATQTLTADASFH